MVPMSILAYNNKKYFFTIKPLLLSLLFITLPVYPDIPFLLKKPSKNISNNENINNMKEKIKKAVISELKKNKGIEVNTNNNFIIPPLSNIENLGSWVSAGKINMTKINKTTFLRIGKGQYKINNQKWDDKKIKINNGDHLLIRHKSSLFNKGEVTTSIYLNDSLKFTFTSTTK
jgi:hypothetical protein